MKRKLSFARIVGLQVALMIVAACNPPYEDPYPTIENAGIVVREDLGREYACEPACARPYFDLVSRWPAAGRSLNSKALKRRLGGIVDEAIPAKLGLGHEELGERIVNDLNLAFMLDGLETRTLEVITIAREEADAYTREKLLIRDPIVGTLEALLLRPSAEVDGGGAGIVGLHGHMDDADVFEHGYLGEDLARSGYVVLIPTSRAMDCGGDDEAVSEALLPRGFHLMSIRVYEALRMVQLLRHVLDTDVPRVGVLGHSGGGSTANVLVRVSDWPSAVVVDHATDYRDICRGLDIHCETVPELFEYHLDINDLQTLPIPYLDVPYKFEDPVDRHRIVEFFKDALGGTVPHPGSPRGETSTTA